MMNRPNGTGAVVVVLFLIWLVQQGPAPSGARPVARSASQPPASAAARGDIPRAYLAHYRAAARTCPRLTWDLLAAIGKIESDHGRSSAPGVRSGLNRAGCCAGPMQFNLTNGPPSTWASFKRPGDSPYDPADAIPAAARKLCANGLDGSDNGRDPCPKVLGGRAVHRALYAYNRACWYVADVVWRAGSYRGRGNA